MARKTKIVTITEENRDKHKAFQITEMPASQAEQWAMRAMLAIAKGGVDLPADVLDSGMAGLATMMAHGLPRLSWEDAGPLLAEMFQCIVIIPDPSKPAVIRHLIEDDIEEVRTRLTLRKEVLELHLDFSGAAGA